MSDGKYRIRVRKDSYTYADCPSKLTEGDMEPRTVDALGEAERDAMWQYDDPIWPAHYAWHPEEGWVYCTRSMPAWRPTAAGHDAVTTATITHGACGQRFGFVEVARFRAGGWVLFTPRGPVAMPDSIGTGWEAKHLAAN